MNDQDITRELHKNRVLVATMLILSFFILILMISIWYDITPKDVIGGVYTQQIATTNISTVYMPLSMKELLSSRYTSDTKEFIYCLYGKTDEKSYTIENMKETTVLNSTSDTITYKACPYAFNLLGTIHSHPQPDNPRYAATCYLSAQDIYTFGASKSQLTAIMCGKDALAFYGTNSFDKSYEVRFTK